MDFDPQAWAGALEASGLGVAMRGSRGLYPAANLAHLLGLVMLVGGIGVLDLRIIGLAPAVPIGALSRLATPLATGGLALLAASGLLLFAADAGPMVRSPVFLAKMGLAGLAVVNALGFRRLFGDLDRAGAPPPLARAMSALSLGLWLAVGCLGRLIAYS